MTVNDYIPFLCYMRFAVIVLAVVIPIIWCIRPEHKFEKQEKRASLKVKKQRSGSIKDAVMAQVEYDFRIPTDTEMILNAINSVTSAVYMNTIFNMF